MAAIALWAVIGSRPRATGLSGIAARYPAIHGFAFLATFAVLWLTALPDVLAATGGVTPQRTPTGVPIYVLACIAFRVWVLIRSGRKNPLRRTGGAGEGRPRARRWAEATTGTRR